VLFERLYGVGLVEAKSGFCSLGSETITIPELALRVAIAAKEDSPCFLSGEQDEHGVGLGNPVR
jgi:hypothetical protein